MSSESTAKRCMIVAEVAQAHDGSLGMAHCFIDAVARAGVDAVKFQTHLAAAESSPSEPWRVKFSFQDATRYEYWKRMEFTEPQWAGLKAHAEDKGLKFLSSAFSMEAVDLLKRIGVAAWKIASGEFNNAQLLDAMLDTGLPVLLSTGMSRLSEIEAAINRIRARAAYVTVMQCTSEYPCPPERVGLNMLQVFRRRFGCGVGLSDHSGTIYPGLAAATIGIDALEVHVTLSREMFGPDVRSSVTTAELRQLVDGIRFIERMKLSPISKDEMAAELAPVRSMFSKSVAARTSLAAGSVIGPGDLGLRKPGTGIPADQLTGLIGRRVRRDIAPGEFLRESDTEALEMAGAID
jgi:N,N'-diacetyllegionaminate synthase